MKTNNLMQDVLWGSAAVLLTNGCIAPHLPWSKSLVALGTFVGGSISAISSAKEKSYEKWGEKIFGGMIMGGAAASLAYHPLAGMLNIKDKNVYKWDLGLNWDWDLSLSVLIVVGVSGMIISKKINSKETSDKKA